MYLTDTGIATKMLETMDERDTPVTRPRPSSRDESGWVHQTLRRKSDIGAEGLTTAAVYPH